MILPYDKEDDKRNKYFAANSYLHSCNHVYLLGTTNELPPQSYLYQKVVD